MLSEKLPDVSGRVVTGPYLPDQRAWVLHVGRAGTAWSWESMADTVEGVVSFCRVAYENIPSIRAEYRIPVQPGVPVEIRDRAGAHPFVDGNARPVETD